MSATSTRARQHRFVEQVMGLPITLALRGRHVDDAVAQEAWAAALAVLRRADEVFSTYRPDSAVRRLGAGTTTIEECPPEVAQVLAIAEQAGRVSDGYFSVHLPDKHGRVHLDPSGVDKGWAIERALTALLEALDDEDGTDVCLAGGGDLACRTVDPHGAPWRIGIEDPADPTRALATVPLTTGAIATSGATHRGGHVLDPHTGRPAEGVASVSVIGPSLLWADVWATAAFARGAGAADWLADRTGYVGFVVAPDGSTRTTGS